MVTTFSSESNSSQAIAVATSAPELLLVSSINGTILREAAPPPSLITQLQFSHSLLFSGSADGYFRTHDPRTGLRKETGESNVQAHLSGIQMMQVSGNFVFTIGWGLRCTSKSMELCHDVLLIVHLTGIQDPFPTPSSKSGTYGRCGHCRRSHSLLALHLSTPSLGGHQASPSHLTRV
jgi:hypothetical protein